MHFTLFSSWIVLSSSLAIYMVSMCSLTVYFQPLSQGAQEWFCPRFKATPPGAQSVVYTQSSCSWTDNLCNPEYPH